MDLHQTFTLVVALGVALVGYSQWRTANQRVVLDLYDRRMKAFDQIEQAVFIVNRDAECSLETFNLFAKGQLDARFVFGEEVSRYLQGLRGAFAMVRSAVAPAGVPLRQDLLNAKQKALMQILNFHPDGVSKFKPYMDLTTRNTSFWFSW